MVKKHYEESIFGYLLTNSEKFFPDKGIYGNEWTSYLI